METDYKLKGTRTGYELNATETAILNRYMEARDIAARAEATAAELEEEARSIVCTKLNGEYVHDLGTLRSAENTSYPVPAAADWLEATQAGVMNLAETLQTAEVIWESPTESRTLLEQVLTQSEHFRPEDLAVATQLFNECVATGIGFKALHYLVWRMQVLKDLLQVEEYEKAFKEWKESAKVTGVVTARIKNVLKWKAARKKLGKFKD